MFCRAMTCCRWRWWCCSTSRTESFCCTNIQRRKGRKLSRKWGSWRRVCRSEWRSQARALVVGLLTMTMAALCSLQVEDEAGVVSGSLQSEAESVECVLFPPWFCQNQAAQGEKPANVRMDQHARGEVQTSDQQKHPVHLPASHLSFKNRLVEHTTFARTDPDWLLSQVFFFSFVCFWCCWGRELFIICQWCSVGYTRQVGAAVL